MAFDPSKLAPSLAAVAGAYAAPGNPGLGAQLGAGLAGALFTSEQERNDAEYAKLRRASVEQQMAFSKEDQEYQRTVRGQEQARLPVLEARAKDAFDLDVKGKKEAIKGQEFNNLRARQDAAFNNLAPAYAGGEANGRQIVAELYQQQYGVAPTPEKLAGMSSNPSVMSLVKLQGAINVMANINPKDEDSRMAGTRYLSSAGITAKWNGEELSIVDEFGSADKDGNGKIDAADLKMAKEELLKSIGREMKYAQVAEDMKVNPSTAAVGNGVSQIALGHMDAGDSMPNERAVATMEEVINRVGREAVAASGTIRAASMYAMTDPDKAAIAVQKFEDAFGGKGYEGFQDPTTGQVMVRVAKAAPWVKQNLDALKATGTIQEDNNFITMPGDRFADIVDSQLKSATLAATPKKSEITSLFNRNMMGSGIIVTPEKKDDNGNVKEAETRETVGSYMRREFIKRAQESLAGGDGNDRFKLSNDELEKFQKSPHGQAIMQELNREVFVKQKEMADAADAKKNSEAKTQLELLNEKMMETRSAAIGKPRGGLLATALEGIGTAVPFNPDSQALSAIATDQYAKREAAGGEPSSLLKNIARKQVEIDNPPYEQLDGRGM